MRRWVYRILLSLPFIALATVLLLPNANRDGAVAREVHIHVIDATTSAPVGNAAVSFNGRAVGSTDAKGDISWMAVFGYGGSTNIFARGHWEIDGDVTVTDPTGRSTTVSLPTLVPKKAHTLWNKGPITATIRHGG
jgi:hypothetical protein